MKILLFVTLLVALNASFYVKHLHDVSTGARCLDGSPSILFMNAGAQHDKFVIYFVGGGFCHGATNGEFIEDCYKRSSTQLGTSTLYPNTMNLDSFGILSTNQKDNPPYWNWTKVVIPYCDGTFHQGTVQQPVDYKGHKLYFRGTNNTLQHFKYLNDYFGLYSANKIIVSGGSAGGIATFIWTDHLLSLSKSKNVFSVPDSGLFLTSYPNPHTGTPYLTPYLQTLFGFVNKQTPLPMQECMKYQKDVHSCLNFSNSVKYFKAPLFIIESQYDQYSLAVILREKCLTQGKNGAYNLDKCQSDDLKDIQSYRNATIAALNNFTILQQFGAWSPACVQHGFAHQEQGWSGSTYKIPTSSGVTLAQAVNNFVLNPKNKAGNIHIDSVSWPNNIGCSAHKTTSKLRKMEQKFFKLISQ